jgi:hypothetical protein
LAPLELLIIRFCIANILLAAAAIFASTDVTVDRNAEPAAGQTAAFRLLLLLVVLLVLLLKLQVLLAWLLLAELLLLLLVGLLLLMAGLLSLLME